MGITIIYYRYLYTLTFQISMSMRLTIKECEKPKLFYKRPQRETYRKLRKM